MHRRAMSKHTSCLPADVPVEQSTLHITFHAQHSLMRSLLLYVPAPEPHDCTANLTTFLHADR